MNPGRIFAHAIARRFAFVAVAAALAWLGLGEAHAASTMAEAYQQCQAAATSQINGYKAGGYPNPGAECRTAETYRCANAWGFTMWAHPEAEELAENGSPLGNYCSTTGCATGESFSFATGQCEVPCGEREDTHWTYPLTDGDAICHGGCVYLRYGTVLGDPGETPTGESCDGTPVCTGASVWVDDPLVPGGVCRPPDGDGDGTPDGSDDFPSDPNESTDSDGDGIGDNGDTAPNDPSNGNDGEDSGEPGDDPGTGPGDETDNRAEGGGTCQFAPTCSGDGIQCNQLFQQWKTRCALERSQASDGSLKVSGTGSGGGIIIGDGSGDGDGLFDDLKDGPDGGEAEAADPWAGADDSWAADESGFGFSRSCPAPPTITLAGMSRTLDTAGLCDLAEIIGALVMLLAAAHAFFALAQN